ncbi:MAG: DUF5103 domain-containing protein [Bacteroidales bacterium]|nr:DUF5103 domain-containing protein [Bacteroidales bacterium]
MAKIYRTETFSSQIKSLQVRNAGDWYAPAVVALNTTECIIIDFDELSHNFQDYYYSVVHCNADWTPSDISPFEYMAGFEENPVEDYRTSFNTQVDYTHYRVRLPNDRVQLKISGNYAVTVYSRDDRVIVLQACFSVLEEGISVGAAVRFNTDVDSHGKHQQLSVRLNFANYRVQNPAADFKVYVAQNGRTDNQVLLKKPFLVNMREMTFDYNRDLIFPAGNEFRRFESVNVGYNGLNVERTDYVASYTHVSLYADRPRSSNYAYDQDQDGRFLIRTSQGSDSDSEGEYVFVHFALQWDDPLIPGTVHLNGELTNYILNSGSKMTYDFDRKQFVRTLLLKQGSYNYQYLFVPTGSEKGETALIEGDFYQTENEYRIMVYHRPTGERYDKLIGLCELRAAN